MPVKPIPDGYHSVTPYLIVADPAKALEFYAAAFGAVETVRMPGPNGSGILHAEMQIGDSRIMLAGEMPAMQIFSPLHYQGSSVSIHLYVPDADASFARAVAAGATAIVPPQEMFWGDRFGKLSDPFGHLWSIATHVKDPTPEEMMAAMAEAFAQGGDCGKKE